ncbi:hypothetical protein RMSM_03933 [Rhodopirellula maiorica SM1]|uniref:Uncharacterized protein n=1 Tax=Rhodopirellula maiorica SM1 TaxID=1265738 RepID=M5RUS0_9BACT|nr:hypothetical protein RMSM_03933 [Rhodopirellula maiorica SM1]
MAEAKPATPAPSIATSKKMDSVQEEMGRTLVVARRRPKMF